MEVLLGALNKKDVASETKQGSQQISKQNTGRVAATSIQQAPPLEVPAKSPRRLTYAVMAIALLALAGAGVFGAMRMLRGEKPAPASPPQLTVQNPAVSTPAPVAPSETSSVSIPSAPRYSPMAGAPAQTQIPGGNRIHTPHALPPPTAASRQGNHSESEALQPLPEESVQTSAQSGIQAKLAQPPPVSPEQNPNSPQAQQIRQWLQEGRVATQARRYNDAAAAFQRVLAVAPKNPIAKAGLEYLDQLKKGDAPSPLPPNQLRSELDRADLLFQNGNYNAAINAFQAVLERNPLNARARNGLVRARKAKIAAARSNRAWDSK